MKNVYRVVTDKCLGFEVQYHVWWIPGIWRMCYGSNSVSNLERAEELAMLHAKGLDKYGKVKAGTLVKFLGRLP